MTGDVGGQGLWPFIDIMVIPAANQRHPCAEILHKKEGRKELNRYIIGFAKLRDWKQVKQEKFKFNPHYPSTEHNLSDPSPSLACLAYWQCSAYVRLVSIEWLLHMNPQLTSINITCFNDWFFSVINFLQKSMWSFVSNPLAPCFGPNLSGINSANLDFSFSSNKREDARKMRYWHCCAVYLVVFPYVLWFLGFVKVKSWGLGLQN